VSKYPDLRNHPLLAKVLEAAPDAVLIADGSLTIIGANARAEALLGYLNGDLAGVRLEDIASGQSSRTLVDNAKRCIEPSSVADLIGREFPLTRSDRTLMSAEISMNRVEDQEQPFLAIALRDTTRYRRIENELRTSQVLLAEAQRLAQLGSWRWDIVSDEITWSSELYRLFGVEPSGEPITYADFTALIHPADREHCNTIIQEAVESRSSFEMEHRIVRPDGRVRLIYGQGAASLDEDGNLVSMIGTAQDVTERKANEAQAFQLALEQAARQEAERTKERFQFLSEVSEALSTSLEYQTTLSKLQHLIIPRLADWCSINTMDASGQINRPAIAHRNPEKQRILETIRDRGFLPHGDRSHPLTRALEDGRPQIYHEISEEMLKSMARSDEHYELVQVLNPTSVMLVPLVARGRAFGVLTFGMSDSGRRYTQNDLQLAIEVAHRAAVSIDNAHLYQEAQEAARAREEFVSLVSHELKTPLTVIKGYIQVMERYLDRPDWERDRIRTTRERLSTQVSRLELLVSDILDVSRMQRGRLDLNVEPNTDIVHLARQVLERFDDAIERRPDHELRVMADGPILGCWDPLRLDQVFSNLVSNALKYSPSGGPIDVTLREEGDLARVEVTDHGVGISQEEQTLLFQPFQRGATSARGISGTGLGLYITRQIIEQHGGEISVESVPGETTTFRFQLPLDPDFDFDSAKIDQ
jgi:PAS domain S-box-containing protein